MKKLSVKSQFRLGAALILLLISISTSLVVYSVGKEHVEQDIHRETEIYIAAVEATRTYVKDVLRPQMYAIVPEDHFIPEAMSTSFVGREIMGRVHDRFKNFRYKRAALYPLNPLNRADVIETRIIGQFNADRSMREWSGVIDHDGHAYFARFRAIYSEAECLRCHGGPDAAPAAILERYPHRSKGYLGHIGEAVATDVVYIPVDVSFGRIKRQAWMTFVMGAGLLFSLAILLHALFNYTVVTELKGLLTNFRSLVGKPPPADTIDDAMMDAGADEIDQLKSAFSTVASDLKQTHDDLRASESKFRRLFESSRDPNFIWDLDKRIIDVNEAGIRMFGFEGKDEALAVETSHQLFWDWHEGALLFDAIREQGFVKDYDISVVNRWGNRLDALVTANLKLDDNGDAVGYEGIIRDITDKRILEKHLVQTEKLASVGQLAAGVAHEINNPLGVIKCYANLIAKNTDNGDQIKADAEIIKKHTKACSKIVEGLLNFARVKDTHKSMIDLHDSLDEVIAVLNPEFDKRGIDIKTRYDVDLPEVVADEEKMKQVFMNLLLNASQAVTAAGCITIATRADAASESVEIDIIDNGSGISPDKIEKIFDPFFTTKKTGEGTGLGLSISYGIVREHGGVIEVTSTPGEGSCFRLKLPVANGERQ